MTDDGSRRLRPPPWDRTWYVLRLLRGVIERGVESDLGLREGSTVVDLGSGTEPYRPLFEEAGCRYIGCDIAGNVDVSIIPGRPIPLDSGSADVVVSFQVLEHVWELDWYLSECSRLLKPGGSLLLSTHGAWLYHPHPEDYRRWTYEGLMRELSVYGLYVYHLEGLVGPLAWTTQFRMDIYTRVLRRLSFVGQAAAAGLCLLMNARMTMEDAITPHSFRQRNACVYVAFARTASGGRVT